MRELAKIVFFVVATVALGCVLAPPLYWLGNAAAAHGIFPDLAGFEFHRYFTRAVLVAAVILLWPLLRALRIRRWQDLGLVPNRARWWHLSLGFGLASLGLGVTAVIIVHTGRAYLRANAGWDGLPGALLSAVAVAAIEESLFRGALLGALRRRLSWPRALILLSLVFAALHFLKPPRDIHFDAVTWTSGFVLFPQLFWQYGDPLLLAGGLLTLVVFSFVLGWTVVQTHSLYAALGLHAGWVFSLKAFGQLARLRGEPTLWLGGDLLTGLVPVALVAVTGLVVTVLLRGHQRASLEG